MEIVLSNNFDLINDNDILLVNAGGAIECFAGSLSAFAGACGIFISIYEAEAVALVVVGAFGIGALAICAGGLLAWGLVQYQKGNY